MGISRGYCYCISIYIFFQKMSLLVPSKGVLTTTAITTTRRQRFALPKPRKARRPEWRLQAAIISRFHKLEADGWAFTCAGDMNAERRGIAARAKAKVTGMTAGEPDIRVYLPAGGLGLIELKAKDGRLSKDQSDRHKRLAELGHKVHVLWAKTPEEAEEKAVEILKGMLGEPRKGP